MVASFKHPLFEVGTLPEIDAKLDRDQICCCAASGLSTVWMSLGFRSQET
jgi:hypothetical protein